MAETPQFAETPAGLRYAAIVSVPFQENTYVLSLAGRDDCVIVDPGMQPGAILELLEAEGLTPAAILCTHGHSDHIAGNGAMKQRWPDAPLVIGEGDAWKLTDPVGNLSAKYGFDLKSPEADKTLAGGDAYEAAGMRFTIRETPGHSAGHVTFLLELGDETHAIAGDVLFQGSVGRTDFDDGDFDQLVEAIHSQLFTLPDDTVVYPGHGPTTTTGAEKKTNPFVGAPAGYLA